ncbi:chymotrypsin-like elastase family member 2A [Megalobrama amblycephala]|uniref:chymotrypsin-like elastase family member 2A n=1 Tax=Megalobrama amblycephala TaxID=75352 RepID=UPI002013DA2C|nr:chymotrypsin-like elastase family member 2A [Megalobrama amblycephala]
MTAAHCISPLVQNYRVQVGKHDLYIYEDFSTTISAQKIIVHEEWNFLCKSQGNDIALIKLSKPVTLSDIVQLGCLPPAEIFLPHGLPCFVTGWGRLSTEGPYPERLQQAKLLIVGNETCGSNYFWGGNINFSMICAGGDGIVAGCSGDFGGPLNCQKYDGTWEVHGIATFVSDLGCNIVNKPTVFTRVSFFTDWIDKVMMNN